MSYQYYANKIGYPCIFSKSTEDAAENLLRLIVNKQCGYVEGVLEWTQVCNEWLMGKYDLAELNFCGASFTETEWKNILGLVIRGLNMVKSDL
jgi:hypothetical protein